MYVRPLTILCLPCNTLPVGRPRWNECFFGKTCRMGLNVVEKVLNMLKRARYKLWAFRLCGCRSIWAFLWVKAANIRPLQESLVWCTNISNIIHRPVLLIFQFYGRFTLSVLLLKCKIVHIILHSFTLKETLESLLSQLFTAYHGDLA